MDLIPMCIGGPFLGLETHFLQWHFLSARAATKRRSLRRGPSSNGASKVTGSGNFDVIRISQTRREGHGRTLAASRSIRSCRL